MITVKNTENLTGVSISGDYNDLQQLVDAFYAVTIEEYSDKNQRFMGISTRVLGLCYDVRHAFQGDREIELVENGMDDEKKKIHSIIAPKSNVYYKFNYLYPEMFFVMLALNDLVKLRIRDLAKSKSIYSEVFNKNVIWDDAIATIRSFQAAFTKCVKETVNEASFARWIKVMNSDYIGIETIAGQYVDLQNIKYINMTKDKRLKNLSIIAKRIAQFSHDFDHRTIKEVVVKAAKEHSCSEGDIRLEGIEYPDEIGW